MVHAGQLTFSAPSNQQSPNIQTNPLPNHQPPAESGVNVLEVGTSHVIKEIPKQRLWRLIVLRSLIRAGQVGAFFHFDLENGCVYDGGIYRNIEDCRLFEDFITIMIKRGII